MNTRSFSKPSAGFGAKPKKLVKDKDRPKRATGAFCFFVANQLKDVKTFDGSAMKKASTDWHQLNDRQKAPYTSKAQADLQRYHDEMDRYKATKLKRPATGYMLFVKEFMSTEKTKYPSATAVVSAASKQWNGMSDRAKAPFLRQAKEESKQYAAEKARRLASQPAPVVKPKKTAAKVAAVSKAKVVKSSKTTTTKKTVAATSKLRSAASATKKPTTRATSKPRAALKSAVKVKSAKAAKSIKAAKPKKAAARK